VNSTGLLWLKKVESLANQGPQHQDFTTLHMQKQFQKLPDDTGLTGFSVPHNLAFLPACEITTILQPTLRVCWAQVALTKVGFYVLDNGTFQVRTKLSADYTDRSRGSRQEQESLVIYQLTFLSFHLRTAGARTFSIVPLAVPHGSSTTAVHNEK